MFTKAQIAHDEAMRRNATEARRLSITSHTHLDGVRHEGAISECNYDAIAKSNREWAATHDAKCVECGHVASESMADPVEGCECCRLAMDALEAATCRYCGTLAEYADAIAHRECPGDAFSARCESGWTGDRCTFPLYHDGPHSN